MNSASEVLKHRYPSFNEPLWYARQWNRSGSEAELKEAATLLDALKKRYPNALAVWYESALNLVKQKKPKEARELLAQIDRDFGGQLDVDTYALWGRCFKDAGHGYLDEALKHAAGSRERIAALEDADRQYSNALTKYKKGYYLSGNWFPGINIAFLLFLRAALARELGRAGASAVLLTESHTRATELADATGWPKKQSDDDVWHSATRGEACALLGKWDDAERHYHLATGAEGVQKHHRESMSAQLRRIVQCHVLLLSLSDPIPKAILDLVSSLNPPGGVP